MWSPDKPMSDLSFRIMALFMKLEDSLGPRVERRVKTFGIEPGMTVVDYGCGPGRYTIFFSGLVGDTGKVYGVDIAPIAVRTVEEKAEKLGLKNVKAVLAHGYDTGLPSSVADRVVALDVFFGIPDPIAFLKEAHRIMKQSGVLILDDGHERRATTKSKLRGSDIWEIVEENKDHLKLRPV